MTEDINSLCDIVHEGGFALHRHLRGGHLEKVYANGLLHRLRRRGLECAANIR